jgi:transposase InsO family protein
MKTSGGTYGSPRVTAELADRGRIVNHKRIERLMGIHDIVGYTPKRRTVTTIPGGEHRIPDLVQRDFTPDGLDVTWAGDITYIRPWEGFQYLAVVEVLASRRILGMSMADHMRASLAGHALTEALGT